MIARISIRCCRCARIAIATPIAPSTIATRQIKLSNPVARSSALGQRRARLAKIRHLRVRQNFLHLRPHIGHLQLVAQRKQIPLRRLAPRLQQPRLIHRPPRDHHPRPQPHARRHPVRLLLNHRRNPEPSPANLQWIADLRAQPYQQIVIHHHRVIGQRRS